MAKDLYINPNMTDEERRNAKALAEQIIAEVANTAAQGGDAVAEAVYKAVREGLSSGGKDARGDMQKLGEDMMGGVADGIAANSGFATDAIEQANASAAAAEQRYLDEKKRTDEAYHQRIYQERLRNAKTYEAAERIRRAEQIRLEKAANDEYLDNLRTAAQEEKRILDAQIREREQQEKSIVSMYDAVLKAVDAKVSEILKLQDRMEQKLANTGKLFDAGKYKFIGAGENGSDWVVDFTKLRDLDEDIAKLEEYRDLLTDIKERGISDDFFTVLRDMSVDDAMRFTEQLMALGDADFAAYIDAWQRKQEAAAEIAKELYKGEADEVAQYMAEAMAEAGKQIPEGFFESGAQAVECFGEGFLAKLGDVMGKIKSAVASDMQGMMPSFSLAGGGSAMGATTVYNSPTYNLMPSGESTAAQLQSIEAAQTVERLRGVGNS